MRPRVAQVLTGAPATLCEPGIDGRFVFWRGAALEILHLRLAIEELSNRKTRRLLKVLLGSILLEASNVIVNGKGRRYRGGWTERSIGRQDVRRLMNVSVSKALQDLEAVTHLDRARSEVLQGDSRRLLKGVSDVDLALFSPPYPNSFDYTDVYNIELWMLGYLGSSQDNRHLRLATLRSHLQVGFEPATGTAMSSSRLLSRTVRELIRVRDKLWDNRIPQMIGGLR
jgi:hypothetical protein